MSDKRRGLATPGFDRRHLMTVGAASVIGAMLPAGETRATDPANPIFVYVGSYTNDPPGGGNNNPIGISVFKFDPADGGLAPVQQVRSANPSFVALDPSHRYLYVINEVDNYEGRKTGSVEAFVIDPNSGMLTLLNRQSTGGPIPAHLTVDPSGRYLIVANYIGGNFVVLPIEADGGLARSVANSRRAVTARIQRARRPRTRTVWSSTPPAAPSPLPISVSTRCRHSASAAMASPGSAQRRRRRVLGRGTLPSARTAACSMS
jgi:DNA-binding beta-propeller fold protein YncE